MEKRFLAMILSVALCFSLCVPVVAANEEGVTYSATFDKEEVFASSSAQEIVLTVEMNKAMGYCSLDYDIVCPTGVTVKTYGHESIVFSAVQAGNNVVSWASSDAEDISTSNIAIITFTLPADMEDGDYVFGLENLSLSSEYGMNVWEDGASVSATLTVLCPHNDTEIRDDKTPSCDTAGYTGDTWCLDCETKIEEGEPIEATGDHVDEDGEWEYDDAEHYYTCGCGTAFDFGDHKGGEATCITKAVCSVCEAEYGQIDAANHEGETELRDAVEATCNAGGYTGDTYCKDCGEKIATGKATNPTGKHVDADGEWESNETQHFYTCDCGTEFGHVNHKGGTANCHAQAVCTACGISYGNLNPAKHDGETGTRGAVEATHTTAGKNADTYCLSCDQTIKTGSTIKAQGHVGARKVAKVDATCVAPGTKAHYHCDVCAKDYDGTSATAAELTAGDLAIPVDADNHVSDGSQMEYDEDSHWGTCDCGAQLKDQPHKGGEATCAARAVCSVCGAAYGERDVDNHGKTEIRDAVEATCTVDGYTGNTYCKDCDTLLTQGKTILAAHKWDKGVVTVQPTEEETGLKVFTCIVCDETKEEILPVKNGVSQIDPSNPEVEEPAEPEAPFSDIAGQWYEADVKYVAELGLMNGVDDGTKFAPEMTTTRGMIVTILWRMEGAPTTVGAVDFTDVADGMWYTAAIDWASANGIVNGYGDGKFGPEDEITREQIMAILNRYAQNKGWTEDTAVSMVEQYTCSVWAENNVNWADMSGLLADLGVDVTDMTAKASRAELAAYLSRFMQNIAK